MTLALEYRPRTFSDVAGQKPVAAVLYQMVRRRTLPSALLFHGVRGCGKTSMARILGSALNCAVPPGPGATWPCGSCPSCKAVADSTSLDVMEVDAASNGGVEDVRRIREIVQYGTSGYRVVLLDEAHSMSRDAFNTLLKPLEEPPAGTLWVLLTTEFGKVPKTVASRCLGFTFNRITTAVIRERLEFICAGESLDMEPALLAAIAERADGALRDAVMLLDQVASVGITSLDMWRKLLGETDFAPGLISAAADGDHKVLFTALDSAICSTGNYAGITGQLVSCFRDLLVLSSGGEITTEGGGLLARRELAARLTPPGIVSAMRVLWDLQTRVRTEDRRAGLELAVVMVSEKLCPQVAPRANGHKPLAAASFGELQLIAGRTP